MEGGEKQGRRGNGKGKEEKTTEEWEEERKGGKGE